MQFIQLISLALPVVLELFSSHTHVHHNSPITTNPTALCYTQEYTLFSASNEMFFKVKATVGVGPLHHLSNVLNCMIFLESIRTTCQHNLATLSECGVFCHLDKAQHQTWTVTNDKVPSKVGIFSPVRIHNKIEVSRKSKCVRISANIRTKSPQIQLWKTTVTVNKLLVWVKDYPSSD